MTSAIGFLLNKSRPFPSNIRVVNNEAKTVRLASSETTRYSFTESEWQTSDTTSPATMYRTGRTGEMNANISLSHAPSIDFDAARLSGSLYDFQKATVAYCLRNERVILGEPTGAGKTVSALCVLSSAQSTPCIIVCPKSQVPMWAQEARRFVPFVDDNIQVINSADETIRGEDITIVGYGMLSYDGSQGTGAIIKQLCEIGADTLIADEAHALRGDSIRSRAVEDICSDATYRMLLTGTPVVRDTVDLDRLLDILDQTVQTDGDPDVVNRRLRAECYVRHQRDVVLSDLPPKDHRVVHVPISNRKEYEAARDKYKHQLSPETGFRALFEFRRTAALGKLHYVEQLRDDLDEPTVLYAIHREVQSELTERFPDAARVVSEYSADRRSEEIDRFQSGDTDTIICAIGNGPDQSPGGVGIELTRAANGIFCELGWTYAHLLQAENRIHRIGQDRAVTVWFPIAERTIDEHVWSLIQERRMLTEQSAEGRITPQELLHKIL